MEACPLVWRKTIYIFFLNFRTFPTLPHMSGLLKTVGTTFLIVSNPGDKVLLLVKSIGLYPMVFLLFRTLSSGLENNDTWKCISDNFLTMLNYVLLLENCWNFISLYQCSQIPRTKLIFMFQFNVARISVCDISNLKKNINRKRKKKYKLVQPLK